MKVCLFYTLVLLTFFGFSQDDAFKQGNAYYESQAYDKAIETYRLVEEQGKSSFELYYNLGNAYFKSNQVPKAILYYEKSKLFNPTSPDLIHNLKLANEQIVDKKDEVEDLYLNNFKLSISNTLSSNWCGIVSLVFLLIAVLFGGLYIWSEASKSRRLNLVMGVTFVSLFVLCIVFSLLGRVFLQKQKSGIIMEPVISVYSAPEEAGQKLFSLHEGSKVELLNTESNWVKIKFTSGKVGWINLNSVEKI